MGWIKRQGEALLLPIIGKAAGGRLRDKVGARAPLVASAIVVAAFVLGLFGETGASDVLMQFYLWFGGGSVIAPEQLVALQDAVVPIVEGLVALTLAAGIKRKGDAIQADQAGTLAKPAVVSETVADELHQTTDGARAALFLELWRSYQNDDGMTPNAAASKAREDVFG